MKTNEFEKIAPLGDVETFGRAVKKIAPQFADTVYDACQIDERMERAFETFRNAIRDLDGKLYTFLAVVKENTSKAAWRRIVAEVKRSRNERIAVLGNDALTVTHDRELRAVAEMVRKSVNA